MTVAQENEMVHQPQITFRNMEPSPAIEADVLRRITWLERFYPKIMGCRVVVEAPHRHRRQGKLYRVSVDLTVPGAELVVGRNPPEHQAHADAYVAIRDAFRSARRALLDHLRLVRGEVKFHEPTPVGRVARLFAEPGGRYGFLESDDGRDVYFHENAVLDGWEGVNVGDRVRYVEEPGDEGPQASTVEVVEGAGRSSAA